jgi:hypothetical protein
MFWKILKWIYRRPMARIYATLSADGKELAEYQVQYYAGRPWGFHVALVLLKHDGKVLERRYCRTPYYRRAPAG